MNTIRTFIEGVFASLPKTREVVEMKLNILSSMEDKYNALIAEGMSENEAVGVVLAEFGSVEELRAELGLSAQPPVPPRYPEQTPTAEASARSMAPPVSPEEEEAYYRFQRREGLGIALAVGLFILSPLLYLLVEEVLGNKILALLFFFPPIALGVGICIYYGITEERFRRVKKALEGRPMEYSSVPFQSRRLAALLSGLLWMGTVVLYLCLGFFWNLWHPGWIVFLIAAGLSIFIDFFCPKED